MIGLDHVQVAIDSDHAVPGAVRLEVRWVRVGNRMRQDERAQIGHLGGLPVMVDTQDAVDGIQKTVRAAGARLHRVQRVVDEGDIRHAADEPAAGGRGLAGRQVVDERGAVTGAGD
ncbi:MAG: hypothetical protein JO352_39750 [Chloroflexi bacterium]|nr:hypothetical protein [Chloroflexota bacterium]